MLTRKANRRVQHYSIPDNSYPEYNLCCSIPNPCLVLKLQSIAGMREYIIHSFVILNYFTCNLITDSQNKTTVNIEFVTMIFFPVMESSFSSLCYWQANEISTTTDAWRWTSRRRTERDELTMDPEFVADVLWQGIFVDFVPILSSAHV